MKLHFLPALLFAAVAAASAQNTPPIHVTVDVTDAPRKILHATLTIPVQPGPLTLVYPEWIPGEHGPTGPIVDLAGVFIRANGSDLAWRRDDVNMFAFHVNVPEGVSSLDVKLDFLATAAAPPGFTAGASTSANLAIISWNELVLYPAGHPAADISVQPAVKLPCDWQYGTALTKTGESERNHPVRNRLTRAAGRFAAPGRQISSRNFRSRPRSRRSTTSISPPTARKISASSPKRSTLTATLSAKRARSISRATTTAITSSSPLSDQVAHFGLEHHQSSDDRVAEKTFIDDNLALLTADLLPHEFTHSWNGKYRRPAGLATGNYEDPMKGDLLWVYEGLTQYLGRRPRRAQRH